MSYETILVEQRGAVTLITLNRPQALNALNSQVLADLIAAFSAFDADDSQRCAVLTGSEKAFAAGADIKEMQSQSFAEMYGSNFFAGYERVTASLISGCPNLALSPAMIKSAIIASSHPPPSAKPFTAAIQGLRVAVTRS